RTGRAIRELRQSSGSQLLSVTVSIGVANSRPEKSDGAESVVQAADQALYRAKAAGRNRVEAASVSRRRTRAKTAGIA
ncbi:MAG: diguanylate cyclase, partial [Candidatus Sulfotelmatobacter sp.]